MAITFVGNYQTVRQSVGAGNHLIVGSDGSLVVSGDDAVLMGGAGAEVTVRGLVAGEQDGVGTATTVTDATVRVAQDGMIVAKWDGVDLSGTGLRVLNEGTISSTAWGLDLRGDAIRVENAGTISSGSGPAVYIQGNSAVVNDGLISSSKSRAVIMGGEGNTVSLVNRGTIESAGSAGLGEVAVTMHGTATVLNQGTIISETTHGLVLSKVGAAAVTSTLFNEGLISGKQIAVGAGSVTAQVVNAGTLRGDVTFGTGHDLYDGRAGELFGTAWMGGGNDVALGGEGAETVYGGDGFDQLEGNGGADVIVGDGGDDTVDGGAGNDVLGGGAGEDMIQGGDGNDIVVGGAGGDIMDGGAGIDDLWYTGSSAGVNVNLATGEAFGGDAQGDELLGFERLWGSGHGDTLTGSAGDNTINGAGGNDLVAGGGGRDLLRGGEGNDIIEGGAGRDILIGDAGNDAFRFRSLSDSGNAAASRDVIRGFVQGEDVIDLSLIDAHAGQPGDQGFAFRDTLLFSGTAPEVRYAHVNGNTLVSLDANGDQSVDMQIMLQGIHALQASDFVL